ncbi:DUF2062 domain-containing protein [Pannonibacter tanglangensis]|uniref:DUF2062 domain-containing protein n=1 Tax=Pannonibacter tanglangensis TaxID=2750084 RepID=A0ABW9ZDP4_9HYPH|nr:DUF2062 domain-containing protein [Pannonibacter sp. XCT-34]NBN62544.1 DUF2062 domain-containing protein [Pannonibacter sp. XCT-34]
MLFQRRTPPSRYEKLRVAVWPRASWARSFRYYGKRVLRLTASPHAVALGFACGAFASFTPFIGFHFLIAAAAALVVRGNVIASALGTVVGNPLTFPFIWAATYKLGHVLMGTGTLTTSADAAHGLAHADLLAQSLDTLLPILEPMVVGGIPLGLLCGLLCYAPVHASVRAYQERKRQRLALRHDAATATDHPAD